MVDWSKAPEWAKYKATDSNGWDYWYENKPTPTFSGWKSEGRVQIISRLNWMTSLEERPL